MEQDHVLRIFEDDGPAYEIDHLETCEVLSMHGGMYHQHMCPVGRLETEWGLGSYMPWGVLSVGEYALTCHTSGAGEYADEDLVLVVSDSDAAVALVASDPERSGFWDYEGPARIYVQWWFQLCQQRSADVQ